MTSVVMIFETTRDYAVIVPLMISNLVSYFIASRLQREPIYERLAEQDGMHLPLPPGRQRERQRQVLEVLKPAGECLDVGETLEQAMEKTAGSAQRTWPVRDPGGVVGIVTRAQLLQAQNGEKPVKELGECTSCWELCGSRMCSVAMVWATPESASLGVSSTKIRSRDTRIRQSTRVSARWSPSRCAAIK